MAVDHSRRLMQNAGERIQSFAFVISVCVCAVLCVFFLVGVSTDGQGCDIELESRINPNEAPISSLVRLPGIGFSRAAAIVAYRDSWMDRNGRNRAFRDCNDLQKVKGIGPKTAENVGGWLRFK